MPSGMATGSRTGCPGALNAFVCLTGSHSVCVNPNDYSFSVADADVQCTRLNCISGLKKTSCTIVVNLSTKDTLSSILSVVKGDHEKIPLWLCL